MLTLLCIASAALAAPHAAKVLGIGSHACGVVIDGVVVSEACR